MNMPERREKLTAMMRELIAEMQGYAKEIDYEDHAAAARWEAEKERDEIRKAFQSTDLSAQFFQSKYMIAKDALYLIQANPANAQKLAAEALLQVENFKPGGGPYLKDSRGNIWLLEE